MFKILFNLELIFLVFLLNACSPQPEQSQDQSQSYIRLSTEEQQNLQQPAEIDEQETNLTDTNQIQSKPDSKQQTLQEEFTSEEQADKDAVPEQTSDNVENQNTAEVTKLPIHDFKERWNAVAEEQMSNLYIKSLDEYPNEKEMIYRSNLSKDIKLEIKANGEYIQQIEMICENKSPSTVYTMLSGWSQMINILHPTIEIYDVDTFFHKIGVGPNADLSNLKSTTISYFDIEYEVLQTDKGYNLTATMNH